MYATPAPRTRDTAILVALLVVGVALRVWQYAADTSMWFDELSIARNVHERSFATLMLHPLGYDQVAPLGFLALVKASAALLGPSDLALRVVPFLCGIAALFLFYRLATRTLAPSGAIIAVALFALGPAFIRYTGELKQYGVDILATIALTLVTLGLLDRTVTVRRCVVAGCVGGALVWFSQAAILIMAGLGAVLVIRWLSWRGPETRLLVRITVPIWAAASLAALVVSRRHVTPETLAFMHAFWSGRGGFLPTPFSASGTVLWFWRQIVDLFGIMMGYPWPAVYAVLTLAGFVILWRQRRDVALVLLGPLAATLLATVANQYPFRTRVVVFLMPSLVLSAAAAIDWLRLRAAAVTPALGSTVGVALLAIPVYALWLTPPPYYTEGFKPVLAYVQAHHQRGDAVYVFSNAYEAIDRYGPRYGIPVGTYIVGICDEREIRPYLQDVDRFRGARRLWVIGASVPEFRPPRQAIGRYLKTIGTRRDSIVVPSRPPIDPVSADLYDLSDPSRLRSATAATFAVPPIGDRHPICHAWIRPTPTHPAP
jgi:dolichyl-phosphate-mannose-protein mannosyltransferase